MQAANATPKGKRSALQELAEASPTKRASIDPPLGTPKSSPAYGRRSSMMHRLSASGSRRRLSGESNLVFDDLIDGFSPIKKDGPVEDFGDIGEEEDLVDAEEVLSVRLDSSKNDESDGENGQPLSSVDAGARDATNNTSAASLAAKGSRDDEETMESEDVEVSSSSGHDEPQANGKDERAEVSSDESEDSDGDLFDIDKLVANVANKQSKANGKQRGPKPAKDEEDASAQLPRRHKTGKTAKPKKPASAKLKNAPSGNRRRTATVSMASDTEGEGDASDDADVWKPKTPPKSKGQKRGSRASTSSKTPAKSSGPKSKTAGGSGARAYGRKSAKQSSTAALHPTPWPADPTVARYFDEIDDFELAEEVV
ncbi:hypothetical protein GGI12_000660 [Dipsacomyces acuminosporus]|nr:hypothetical protein GGI12_000660 [Dipsacomyces acuminosporus]